MDDNYAAVHAHPTQARFKYPPHWVPLPMLYEAMQYVDPVTGQPRGFLRISARPLLDSVLLTLDIRSNKWHAAHRFMSATVPKMLQVRAGRCRAWGAQQRLDIRVGWGSRCTRQRTLACDCVCTTCRSYRAQRAVTQPLLLLPSCAHCHGTAWMHF
jgi:hypothetical protein